MKPLPRLFSTFTVLRRGVGRWHLLGLVGVLAATSSLRAENLTIRTDTTWRAIGPEGNLEGSPIDSVGRAWEAAHPGWNTNLAFDDSEAAGWRATIISPLAETPVGGTNSIWVDGNGYDGATPAYFRKVFTLCGTVKSATLNVHVDDDALVYLNGALLLEDRNRHWDNFLDIDVTQRLRQGQNLLAIKAHDSAGGGEQVAVELTIEFR